MHDTKEWVAFADYEWEYEKLWLYDDAMATIAIAKSIAFEEFHAKQVDCGENVIIHLIRATN